MKIIANVIYYIGWVVHGAVLAFGDITVIDWRFWVLTLAMACSVFFNPTLWRD